MSCNNWGEGEDASLDAIRREIIRRIMAGDESDQKPATYIKHLRLRDKVYDLLITLVMFEDSHSAYRANDRQADAIMEADAQWYVTTPCWKQNLDRTVVPTFSEEDEKLLREMQAHIAPD